jgi:hypothetical protein
VNGREGALPVYNTSMKHPLGYFLGANREGIHLFRTNMPKEGRRDEILLVIIVTPVIFNGSYRKRARFYTMYKTGTIPRGLIYLHSSIKFSSLLQSPHLISIHRLKPPFNLKWCMFSCITTCSPFKINRRFGGTCRLHLGCRSITELHDNWITDNSYRDA